MTLSPLRRSPATAGWAAALAVLGVAAAHPAAAQTTVSGTYQNRGNGYDATSGSYVVITPATFENNVVGLLADPGVTVTINGGIFTGNGTDLTALDGTITLYGDFVGGGRTPGTGSGTFTGTLENDQAAQTFSYINSGSGIALVEVPPASAAFACGTLGLAGLIVARRKKTTVKTAPSLSLLL